MQDCRRIVAGAWPVWRSKAASERSDAGTSKCLEIGDGPSPFTTSNTYPIVFALIAIPLTSLF